MDMRKLMCPKSLVVVGATDKPGMTGNGTQSAIQGTNKDHVYYVSLKRDEVFGRKCYHSLAELPEVPECMLLLTPAKTVAGYLEEAGKMGIGAAVVIASGFSEERTEEAHRMAKEVEDVCNKYDIALCGPNCVGIVNALDGVVQGTHVLEKIVDGGIAVVAQSGYLTGGFRQPNADQLAYVVSAGNSSVCSVEDYMCWFADDDRVTVISAYLEGVKKPERLVYALETAAKKRKPVVILKAGESAKGSFAVASHTGSLAGNYATYQAIFKKFGVVACKTAQEWATTSRMFSVLRGKLPEKLGICGLNFSGGENTQFADNCERYGIDIPEFDQSTVEKLRAVLPSYSTPANPLDATTTLFSETEKVRTLFTAISEDPNIGIISLGNDMGANSEPKDITCVKLMTELRAEGKLLPTVISPTWEKPRHADFINQLENAGIPLVGIGDQGFKCIRHLLDFAAYKYDEHTLELALPAKELAEGKLSLSEAQSKAELTPYGVRVPGQALAKDAAEVEAALAKVPFPVVMKVESPDILHKTDAGAVKLNINTKEDALKAFDEIMANCKAYKAEARIDGVMIQEMVPNGVEIILGINNDKMFGPMLLAGLGGVFTEVFKDASLLPCPISKKEACEMLKDLKGYKLLTGYRGSKPCDIDALTDLMVKVSEYAVEHKNDVAEMDMNPVFVYEEGKGVCVTDALIVKRV